MLLFVNDTVVPEHRLIDIIFRENVIVVNYDGGDLIEVAGTFQKKIETVRVVCDNPDDANKIKRQFYKACAVNQGVFYFGNSNYGNN